MSNYFASFLLGESLIPRFNPSPSYIIAISERDAMTSETKLKPFLVRLRPETRVLLDSAAQEQRRSRASLIDQAVVEMLAAKYSTTADRLSAMLGSK